MILRDYKIKIDNEKFVINESTKKGKEILILAQKEPYECFELFQKIHGNNDLLRIEYENVVDFSNPGIEKFITKPLSGKKLIYVDDEEYYTSESYLTPNQILELADISIEDHYLKQIVGTNQISYKDKMDESIKICPNMKFVSIFIGETPVACNIDFYYG